MRRKITTLMLAVVLGLLGIGVAVAQAQQFVTGPGYSVLYDAQGRCVFGVADSALPSNLKCQDNAVIYRSDLAQFYTVSSGTWSVLALTAGNIATDAVTTTEILDATIVAADLAADSVEASEIAAGAVTASEIATSGVATAEILNGTIINEDVDAAAAIARSKLAEDALQVFQVPEIRNATFGAAITATEAEGTFNWTLGTNTVVLSGEVTDNETETSVGYFVYVLPPEYVAAGDVTVRFRSELLATGAPTDNASSLDLSCYEQADGAVGADIVATAAATYLALDTFYSKDFVVTATGLVAGDILVCKITTAIVDSEAGAGTITWTADPPKILLDIKG